MVAAKSVRIDPVSIQKSVTPPPPNYGQSKGASFGDFMGIAGAFAPAVGEATYQSSGNPNAAAVLHSAFSALPGSYGAAKGAYAGGPGMFGSPSYGALGASGVGGGYGGTGIGNAGLQPDGLSQSQLLDQMNTNNLQLLELQATMQNNMQQWTTKSNVLKSVHDAKMAMIRHFSAQG